MRCSGERLSSSRVRGKRVRTYNCRVVIVCHGRLGWWLLVVQVQVRFVCSTRPSSVYNHHPAPFKVDFREMPTDEVDILREFEQSETLEAFRLRLPTFTVGTDLPSFIRTMVTHVHLGRSPAPGAMSVIADPLTQTVRCHCRSRRMAQMAERICLHLRVLGLTLITSLLGKRLRLKHAWGGKWTLT